MRRVFLTLWLTAWAAAPAHAQDVPAIAFEHLTVAGTAVSLAPGTTNPSGKPAAQYCRALAETAELRGRVDSGVPTSTVGTLIPVGATVELRGADSIRLFQAIRTGGTSGALPFTCYALAPTDGGGSFVVTTATLNAATTGTGNDVHADSPSLTDATIAAGALSGTFTGSPVLSGEPLYTGRLLVRENFDAGLVVVLEDFSAKALTDAAINLVVGSPLGIIEYREELGKTASSWVQAAGAIDISADDTTDNEGVEIYLGDDDNTATGWILAGTSGLCFEVNFTITLIAGTDQFVIGWRQNEAFVDGAVYSGYTDWAIVGITNVDGSVFANHEIAGGAGALSDDSGVNAADGETHTLKSCISTAGAHSAYLDGTAITMTNGAAVQTAGTYMNPFISYLASAGAADAAITINWMQVGPLP